MPASYPTTVKPSFGAPRIDLQSVVVANDVNPVYEEVLAIESTLGADVQKRKENWGTGSFSTTSTTWTNLRDRLENSENGMLASVKTYGGSVISNATGSTGSTVTSTSLTIRQATGQTSNLMEFRNSTNDVVAFVSVSGLLQAATLDGGSAASSGTLGA
jgi:hypothetical protein